MKKLLILLLLSLLFACSNNKEEPGDTTIKDGSGNIYTTITVDQQTWLQEDMHATKLINGQNIKYVESRYDITSWGDEYTLYNGDYFYASGVLNYICPNGYRLPNNSDWTQLINYFGGKNMGTDKITELINILGFKKGSVSGFNETSSIYFSNYDIVYFRTSDGIAGFNVTASPNRIRCIQK